EVSRLLPKFEAPSVCMLGMICGKLGEAGAGWRRLGGMTLTPVKRGKLSSGVIGLVRDVVRPKELLLNSSAIPCPNRSYTIPKPPRMDDLFRPPKILLRNPFV